jgi:hypothetical protein
VPESSEEEEMMFRPPLNPSLNALKLASIICLSSFTTSASYADSLIISSLNQTADASSPSLFTQLDQESAQKFRTGAQRYRLTSIIARVGKNRSPLVFAELRSSDTQANLPTAGPTGILTTFTIPTLPNAMTDNLTAANLSDAAFTPNTNFILEANTDYWFGIGTFSSADSGVFGWGFTDGNGAAPGAPNEIAGSGSAGQAWVGPGPGDKSGAFFIEVRGELLGGVTAPEPSSMTLLSLAFLPLAIALRRRR